MSKKHPVIAVTGSSGAGTSTVKTAFAHIFHRQNVVPMMIQGDSFHRYNRADMKAKMKQAETDGEVFSHFAIEANLLHELSDLFEHYSQHGWGRRRYYIHNEEEAAEFNDPPGCFSEWKDAGHDTDLLFYEGLHGAVVTDDIDTTSHVDLLVGVVPIINLEWIQKIHRDTGQRGYGQDEVKDIILRRMNDYVNVIAPQFSHTDINFQRVPTVDTSNPFVARDIPTPEESIVVIRFRDPKKFDIDFPYLLSMLDQSFMSRRNTIVVPGGKMGLAIEIIFGPIIERIVEEKMDAMRQNRLF